jgi:hypothetical protein
MNSLARYVAGSLLGLCLVTGGAVFAQEADPVASEKGRGMGHQMPSFAEFDLNGDGVIAEDEFYKARGERIAKRAQEGREMKHLKDAPSFDDLDTDDDGGVSPDEFSTHQAEHMEKMRGAK